MPQTDLTHVILVLDRSGSMGSVRDDAIGGFNTFVAQQAAAPGEATLTLVQFDHEYEVVLRALDMREVRPLDKKTYVPRGQTALYDAVGRAVAETTEYVRKLPTARRPAKVIVAILTDGAENASREYGYADVQKLITQKRRVGWEFLFLGANMDVVEAAARIGIPSACSYAFDSTGEGTRDVFVRLADAVTAYRSTPRDED